MMTALRLRQRIVPRLYAFAAFIGACFAFGLCLGIGLGLWGQEPGLILNVVWR